MQCSQIIKPHLGRRSCCTASTNTLSRLYDGTRFLKRKPNEKMVILGMRGGPGSWIGQDYRGVYWRYWVGSGEPPAETTETKRKGGGKKGEKRAREKKKVRMSPRKKGGGKNEHHKYSQGQHITITTAATVSSFFWCTVGWFIVFLIHLEIQLWASIKKLAVLFAELRARSRDMKLLPNTFPISEVNWTAATRIYKLFIKNGVGEQYSANIFTSILKTL